MKLLLIILCFLPLVTKAQNNCDSCVFYVPNVVTVNCGNYLNNDFLLTVYSNCKPKKYVISVYNRWGETLFTSNKISDWFDMIKQPDGIYIYVINVDFGDGEKEVKGTFTKLS